MILIVDYNMGNIGSISNMLSKAGAKVQVSSSREEIEQAKKIILPGVGRFDAAMKQLNNLGLIEVLNKKALQDRVPILGICLGMQLMTLSSEEGNENGLGWIPAHVKKFDFKDPSIKVPHMGWNRLLFQKDSPLVKGLDIKNRFYFVHSYHVQAEDPGVSVALTDYHTTFVSVFQKNNIFGAQFHPEKSHRFGLALMKNFVNEVPL